MKKALSLIFIVLAVNTVSGILPDFGYNGEPESENGISGLENLPVFEKVNPDVTRVVKSAQEGLSIDELTNKLMSKVNAIAEERPAGRAPAKSIRELEDLMMHPTWLTDTSNKKNDQMMSKNRKIHVVPEPAGNNWNQKTPNEEQRDHIREIITKFHDLKPKEPITDNRITKFVFTHDADLATSKTVQEHNREVEAAFMDFNKKLEETLNIRNKKPEIGKTNEKEIMDRCFNRVVNFLDKNIRKLKEDTHHKQVCRKHKSHPKESLQDREYLDASRGFKKMSKVKMMDDGVARLGNINYRFSELAQTRDGLENVLLGLDRPRSGPYKRHVFRKFHRVNVNRSKSRPMKHH